MMPWSTWSKVYRVPFALIKAPHVTFAPILTFALEQFLVIGTLIKTGSISSISTSGRATAKCNLHECCVQRFWFFWFKSPVNVWQWHQIVHSNLGLSPLSFFRKSTTFDAVKNYYSPTSMLCRVNHVVTRGKWAYTKIERRHNTTG